MRFCCHFCEFLNKNITTALTYSKTYILAHGRAFSHFYFLPLPLLVNIFANYDPAIDKTYWKSPSHFGRKPKLQVLVVVFHPTSTFRYIMLPTNPLTPRNTKRYVFDVFRSSVVLVRWEKLWTQLRIFRKILTKFTLVRYCVLAQIWRVYTYGPEDFQRLIGVASRASDRGGSRDTGPTCKRL